MVFNGGYQPGFIPNATVEYSTMEYPTNVRYVQPWNISWQNVPQMCNLRVCGIFHHGIFHVCANSASAEYSTVALRNWVDLVFKSSK